MATKVVGSAMPPFASAALKPSSAGYGQNGYGGASSDLPGQNTKSGFLPDPDLAKARDAAGKILDRRVSNKQYTPSYGMKPRS